MSNQTINQKLWASAERGQWQKLPALLAAGADIYALNEDGSNALHLAGVGNCARHLKTPSRTTKEQS
jgi:ankyrin repeat protein